jgi:hypothetical protein
MVLAGDGSNSPFAAQHHAAEPIDFDHVASKKMSPLVDIEITRRLVVAEMRQRFRGNRWSVCLIMNAAAAPPGRRLARRASYCSFSAAL